MSKVRVTFWLTEECKGLLETAAQRLGLSQGAMVETAIRSAVRSLARGSSSSRRQKRVEQEKPRSRP